MSSFITRLVYKWWLKRLVHCVPKLYLLKIKKRIAIYLLTMFEGFFLSPYSTELDCEKRS